MRNKAKYNYENGFVVLSSLNKSEELENYIGKLFLRLKRNIEYKEETIEEVLSIYTANKKYKDNKELSRNICPKCGSLSNSFYQSYESFYGMVSRVPHCSCCGGLDMPFLRDERMRKLNIKAFKYGGKSLKKLKRLYRKWLKEHKKMLSL